MIRSRTGYSLRMERTGAYLSQWTFDVGDVHLMARF